MIKVIRNSENLILICLLMVSSLAFSQGSRYTGTYKKSAPLVYKNQKNIVIEGLEIDATNSYCIALWNCENVIIKNSKFTSAPNKRAIYIERGTNITVIDSYFENVYEGVLADKSTGNIKIEYNDFKNIRGQLDGGSYFANAIQFNRVSGSGNSISYNSIENLKGQSSPEDIINLYASNGTPSSPIMIKGNWLRGGGPNPSGGGIMLGDHGGSYLIAEDNILVDPGQYGMAIGGGDNMTIRNNKIYGKRQSFTNVGLYAVNWTSKVSPSYNITIENNEINFTNSKNSLNNIWFDASVGTIKGRDTNKYNKDLNESILPKVIIGTAKNTDNNTPPVSPPDNNTPDTPITHVYIDSYKRIAIKYLVPSIPVAHAEGYSSNGKLLITMKLPRYNQAFPISVPKGDYYVKITYPELDKTETTKVTIK